ncbi:hypothetical protein OG216_42240 [Streptomycetaceae bacterium NBC_01309]
MQDRTLEHHEFEYRATFAVDIEKSAGRGNTALLTIREVLRTALRASVERSGVAWDDCLRHDLGDGLRVTVPPGTPKVRLIHPLVPELAARLQAHNRTAGPPTRIRVRMALHAGDVRLGPDGEVAGQPLELLARLLDAAPARTALAEAPADLPVALLISRHYHDETVGHGYPGVDPDAFHNVAVAAKECATDAWLHVPGLAGSPPSSRPDRGAPARGGSRMINTASGNGVVHATQHGTQHIHVTGPGRRPEESRHVSRE